MRSPPRLLHEHVWRDSVEAFIRGEDNEAPAGRTDVEAWMSAAASDAAELGQEAMAIA